MTGSEAGKVADPVRASVNVPAPHSAAREHDRKRIAVMVPARVRINSRASAEFAHPDDQGFVERRLVPKGLREVRLTPDPAAAGSSP